MTPIEAARDAPLFDARRHGPALVALATRLLATGHAFEAFEWIDRRCRLGDAPGASHLAIRALAGRLSGWPHWQRDLVRAVEADPIDPVVNLTLLRLGSSAAEKDAAARRILANHRAGADAKRTALTHLWGSGERAFLHLERVDDRLSGWGAWTGEGEAVLELIGDDVSHSIPLADERLSFVPENTQSSLIASCPSAEAIETFRLCVGGEPVAEGRLIERSRISRHADAPFLHAPLAVPNQRPLVIVIPVHSGFDATQDCLRAAIAGANHESQTRVLVVDDASPDRKLRLLLDVLAKRGLIELLRNQRNLGFAGSVNRALDTLPSADVLLLNADAVLPQGAIQRLRDAVYSAPDIGTATPLSNNGEYTSVPKPCVANPFPQDPSAWDAAAAAANPGLVVDMPTGTGFCLMIRHDCRAAVGPFPQVYGRGYFEDMEFCVRARRHGFRSVCAASVYVPHHGSLSFGAEKQGLVVGNLRLFRDRFPDVEPECAAYAAADPLAEARIALAEARGENGPIFYPANANAPHHVKPVPPAPVVERSQAALGIVPGPPSAETMVFLRDLSTALRARLPEARLVVFGPTLDDLSLLGRGNVFVTGPCVDGPCEATLRYRGVRLLLVPAGSVGFTEQSIPTSFLLPLDPDHRDRHSAFAIADRFASGLEAAAP